MLYKRTSHSSTRRFESMTNLRIPFECPICGSDGFTQVEVKGRDGVTRRTQAYECRGCSTMFRERERYTKHRQTVIGADGVDLKSAPKDKRSR